MNLEFDQSFLKSLNKVSDVLILKKIEKTILEIEKAKSLDEIRNLHKLSGFKNYFRIRLGDYRIGLELVDNNTIRLILIANRKDIYKYFPGK